MRKRVYFVGFVFTFLLVFSLSAQNSDGSKLQFPEGWTDAQKELLISSIDSFPNQTEISIAIIQGDKTDYIGVKNKEGQLINVDNKNANFEIGSITKVFTSTLLAKSIKSGEVTLDTDITELTGFQLKDSVRINLQQLSNHTSGLARMPQNFLFSTIKNPDNPYSIYDEKLLKEWLTVHMSSELNQTQSEYSNLGVALLAYGLSKKADKSYDQILKSEIFSPLDMTQSTVILDQVKDNMVAGLKPDGSIAPNWEFDVLGGAGAIYSTVEDMDKFMRKVISRTDEALNLQLEPTFKVSDKMSMGLAWHIFNIQDDKTYYWHNGATGGYTSSMIIDVENSNAVIILSNVNLAHPKSNMIDSFVFGLMKSL